jgi:hypothetical protein
MIEKVILGICIVLIASGIVVKHKNDNAGWLLTTVGVFLIAVTVLYTTVSSKFG